MAKNVMASNAEDLSGLPLSQLVDVEALNACEYKGKNLGLKRQFRALFGGQLMGQALKAAHLSVSGVDSSFIIQSYHCYFIGPVQPSSEVIYKVDHVKIGSSFCTVLVNGIQDSRVKFHCMISFHKAQSEDHDIDYCTRDMPNVPRPIEEDVGSSQILQKFPPKGKFRLLKLTEHVEDNIVDIQMCEEKNHAMPAKPKAIVWIRSNMNNELCKSSDHQNLHRINFVFPTDYGIGGQVELAYPSYKYKFSTSLDHSVWFYGDVKDGDWYLHCQELEHSSGGRTLNSTRVYNEHGELIAICKQESLFVSNL